MPRAAFRYADPTPSESSVTPPPVVVEAAQKVAAATAKNKPVVEGATLGARNAAATALNTALPKDELDYRTLFLVASLIAVALLFAR